MYIRIRMGLIQSRHDEHMFEQAHLHMVQLFSDDGDENNSNGKRVSCKVSVQWRIKKK